MKWLKVTPTFWDKIEFCMVFGVQCSMFSIHSKLTVCMCAKMSSPNQSFLSWIKWNEMKHTTFRWSFFPGPMEIRERKFRHYFLFLVFSTHTIRMNQHSKLIWLLQSVDTCWLRLNAGNGYIWKGIQFKPDFQMKIAIWLTENDKYIAINIRNETKPER